MRALYLADHDAYLCYTDLPGRPPARVYIHGLGGASSADFVATASHPTLAGHRSILVDLLGFGFSDKPHAFSYTLEAHAETVARLLDHLGLAACDVVGHSMGGSVAITLAALRPDLVGRLVVAEANLDRGGGPLSRHIASQSEEAFTSRGFRHLLEQVRREAKAEGGWQAIYLATLSASAPHALYRSARSLVEGTRPTMRERLLGMTIPRAFLFGERSLPDPDAQQLPAAGIRVLMVPGAGHPMMHENLEGFVTALAAALHAGDRPQA